MNNIAAIENKVTETIEDEAVTELKEEVTMKQFESLNSVPSIEQERRQKQSQQSLDKVLTLHKEVMETEKLVERRTEMSHLDDQLEEKTELLKCDFKEELSLEQNYLDAAVGRQLAESEKLLKQGQEQSNNISLQQEVEKRDKETAAARKKTSDL